MFTGLIETVGRLERLDRAETECRLRVSTTLAGQLTAGDSIAVDGVCLTVTATDTESFDAEVSPETQRVTTLATATVGQAVNLERAVRADARLGGHFVLGHVDGVGRVHAFRPDGDSHWLDVDLPESMRAGVVLKGSVAIDGISLTVAAITGARIGVQIVPFTIEHTSLRETRPGDPVNLETDVIGKYVARLLDLRDGTDVQAAGGPRS